MTRSALYAVLTAFATAVSLALLPGPSSAQTAPVPRPAPPARALPPDARLALALETEPRDADKTRDELYQLLEKYPPNLGRVLKLDPSLMGSEVYLAAYPALAAFLAEHPEVGRDPVFFLERVTFEPERGWAEEAARRERSEMLGATAAFFVFLVVTGVVVWLVRTIIDNRRWNKVSKTQFDVHSRLLERFSTNEEVLAYIQTPVGRRFIESGPAPLPDEPRHPGAPLSRILWSLQAGIVLLSLGIGLTLLSRRVDSDVSLFFMVFGAIALALGGGFLVSAGASYGLSRRFGLVGRPDVDRA